MEILGGGCAHWCVPSKHPIAAFVDKTPKAMDFSDLPSQVLVF
jgi:hypothetical protein